MARGIPHYKAVLRSMGVTTTRNRRNNKMAGGIPHCKAFLRNMVVTTTGNRSKATMWREGYHIIMLSSGTCLSQPRRNHVTGGIPHYTAITRTMDVTTTGNRRNTTGNRRNNHMAEGIPHYKAVIRTMGVTTTGNRRNNHVAGGIPQYKAVIRTMVVKTTGTGETTTWWEEHGMKTNDN